MHMPVHVTRRRQTVEWLACLVGRQKCFCQQLFLRRGICSLRCKNFLRLKEPFLLTQYTNYLNYVNHCKVKKKKKTQNDTENRPMYDHMLFSREQEAGTNRFVQSGHSCLPPYWAHDV